MFRPHLSYIAAISVNRRTSGYPWRGGPVRSDFQWRLLYPVNLRCLARSGRWRQRSSKWLGMLVIMLWTRCQVLISHLHNSWILNPSNVHWYTIKAIILVVGEENVTCLNQVMTAAIQMAFGPLYFAANLGLLFSATFAYFCLLLVVSQVTIRYI